MESAHLLRALCEAEARGIAAKATVDLSFLTGLAHHCWSSLPSPPMPSVVEAAKRARAPEHSSAEISLACWISGDQRPLDRLPQ
jgi:hypothetical protein